MALFDLRHFADTTGDGVRDTLRVAIADLGAGLNNSFTNNGTLALPAVTGATTLDSTGQYLPLGNPNNAMALGGPLQGHLIGVQTFTNSGTIDLQSNPVAGDVLVITGARQAGVLGTGTFISGGTLKLDTVLNEGGAATRSDTLVVDGTRVGSGPTNTAIRNAGGAGALTVGDGILVVQVLDPSRSAAGVFKLGAPAIAGPYEYTLFHGGVGADAANGNWYLRSTLSPTPEPTPQSPDFRAETSLYAAIPSMALLYGRNLLDTLHERVGEEFDEGVAPAAAPRGYYKAAPPSPASPYLGWGRIFGMSGVQQGDSLGVLGGSGRPAFRLPLPRIAGRQGFLPPGPARWLARSCRRLFRDRHQPGTGHPFRRHTRQQQLRRLHARRLLDPLRADRLVHRCNPAGHFLRHQLDCQPRPADVQDARPGYRRLARNRISLQVYRRLVHRTAGATGVPEHQHQ